MPIWDGKKRHEPGAWKEWKREIKAIQIAYDIPDSKYAPLVFLATKDEARDVVWDLDEENQRKGKRLRLGTYKNKKALILLGATEEDIAHVQ